MQGPVPEVYHQSLSYQQKQDRTQPLWNQAHHLCLQALARSFKFCLPITSSRFFCWYWPSIWPSSSTQRAENSDLVWVEQPKGPTLQWSNCQKFSFRPVYKGGSFEPWSHLAFASAASFNRFRMTFHCTSKHSSQKRLVLQKHVVGERPHKQHEIELWKMQILQDLLSGLMDGEHDTGNLPSWWSWHRGHRRWYADTCHAAGLVKRC